MKTNIILQTVEIDPVTPSKKARLQLLQLFDDETDDSVSDEIDRYLNIKVNKDVDPLGWWQQNAELYPNLASLANIYFGIPATSASSESAFSTAGNTMIAKRSNLHPSKLNKLTFIHDNYDYIVSHSGFKNMFNGK